MVNTAGFAGWFGQTIEERAASGHGNLRRLDASQTGEMSEPLHAAIGQDLPHSI